MATPLSGSARCRISSTAVILTSSTRAKGVSTVPTTMTMSLSSGCVHIPNMCIRFEPIFDTVVRILGHVYPLHAWCNARVVWWRSAARDSRIMSRAIRPSKHALLWTRYTLKTFDTVEELRLALHTFQRQYNETWLIGRHGYKAPAQVRQEQRCALAEAA